VTAGTLLSPVVVDAYPQPVELAVVAVPVGGVARIHYPSGPVMDYPPPLDDEAWIAVVPGDKDLIGWGCVPCWYGSPRGVRNGRHVLDRPVWQEAARQVCRAGVVYVEYRPRLYYGRERWTAESCRIAGGEHP
jgi:hypothetical protein